MYFIGYVPSMLDLAMGEKASPSTPIGKNLQGSTPLDCREAYAGLYIVRPTQEE